MNQSLHIIARCEAGNRAGAMLVQPTHQIRCDADIDRGMTTTAQQIDARLTFHSGAALMDADVRQHDGKYSMDKPS
ncbi:MAG: hypothetical protein A3H25_13265 [Sphingomonadales bacterium RIFCSPLOWO2_12_FULL_63_15]|nr:MAG: hypothetical protein A3H25_13265 [Sphingomonadales bacterium RIFCSPLOWO2_12_FULL_63_15]